MSISGSYKTGKFKSNGRSLIAWRIWLSGLIATALVSLVLAAPAIGQANGGTPVFNGDSGNFNVYLTISPSPPTPNVPAHFTMILTKKASDQPVTGATVFVEPTMTGMAMPGLAKQRFVQTQGRPNQYDIDVPVTMEGTWLFAVTIVDPGLGDTTFTVNTKVEKPDAPWPIIIAILVALPLLVGLTWFFLFRKTGDDDDDDETDDEPQESQKIAPKRTVRPERTS